MLKKYKIERNDKCLCGSGKKYKRCCQTLIQERANNLKYSLGFLNVAEDFLKRKNLVDAEKFFRAHLTQYIIWYHEHTVPFRKAAPEAAKDLFHTDIEAINEIADSIVRILYNQNKIDGINLLYLGLVNIIEHPLYEFYIDCQRAYWLDYANKKLEAEKIFTKYAKIEICDIPATYIGERSLEIYLRFTYLKIPAVKSLTIIEKSLVADFEDFFKLFLLTYKMRIAFLHNDIDMAKSTAVCIIQKLNNISKKDVFQDIMIRSLLPDTYEMLAVVLQECSYYTKLIDVCMKNLEIDKEDNLYSAAQNHLIAQGYMSLGELDKAKEYILKAIALNRRFEFQLDLVQINLKLDNQSEALLTLKDIDYDKLSEGLKIDHLSYCTDIALTNKPDC